MKLDMASSEIINVHMPSITGQYTLVHSCIFAALPGLAILLRATRKSREPHGNIMIHFKQVP